jgi:hypothetical protein
MNWTIGEDHSQLFAISGGFLQDNVSFVVVNSRIQKILSTIGHTVKKVR